MCQSPTAEQTDQVVEAPVEEEKILVSVNPETMLDSAGTFVMAKSGAASTITSQSAGWLSFNVKIPVAGRYRSTVTYSYQDSKEAAMWIEDYIDNKDDRTYDITGKMRISASNGPVVKDEISKDGSPLNAGLHPMKLHVTGSGITVHSFKFELLRRHKPSPKILTQNMHGGDWSIAWSDEFDGAGLPDTSKWTFDLGDWGWGNNEVQYYTENRTDNARLEDGFLVIEARKNDFGKEWTSTRLTTRGKVAFTYGRIEFRAKVPSKKGTWAAGWTLGNDYVDEISWPYCGEIDILESVGFETDDETGDGIAHATVHTRAYYFKAGNHFTADTPVAKISEEFHIYAVEWSPTEIKAYVNDIHYYTYDKTANELEWPFHEPQNIILNLTMGGGWGGEIDPGITSQQFIIDYVRVYERK